MEIGDLVTLKSGGVPMTVTKASKSAVTCMFYNPISGKIEQTDIPPGALRESYTAPAAPTSATYMRGETVAKSTL